MKDRHALAFLTALLLALLVPAAVHAADEPVNDEKAKPAEPVVTLLEAGEEPRVALRFKPEKGATEESEMRMRMRMQQTMNGMQVPPTQMPVMRIVMSTTVDEVKENGDVAYTTTFTKTEVGDERGINPMIRQQITQMLQSIEGLEVRAVVSSRGIPRDSDMKLPDAADPMMRQQLEGMMGSVEQFAAPVPEEAVGVGGKWKVESTVTQQGMTMKQTTTYTVKSINGDEVELEVELAQSADPQDLDSSMMPPGASVRLSSLNGKGSGETKLALNAVLPQRAQIKSETEMDMAMNMGGQSQNVTQRMELDMRLAAVEAKAETADEGGE